MASQRKTLQSQCPFFQPARSPEQHQNRGIDPKHEDTLRISIAVPPSRFRGWYFRAPSAHPRKLPSLRRNKEKRLAAAHVTTHAVALVYTPGRCFVGPALRGMPRYSDFIEKSRTIRTKRTWSPSNSDVSNPVHLFELGSFFFVACLCKPALQSQFLCSWICSPFSTLA